MQVKLDITGAGYEYGFICLYTLKTGYSIGQTFTEAL